MGEIPRPQVAGLTIFEVENREFLMVFFGGMVIRDSGGGFVLEVAEVDSFSVANDGGPPEVFFLIEPNALIS